MSRTDMSQRAYTRLPEDQRDFFLVKQAAAQFYRLNRVQEHLEDALNDLFSEQPGDVHGHLASYFASRSAPPRISRLQAREVYDARGQPSIAAEVFCIICNKEKSMCSAAVSSHFGPNDTSLEETRADHVMTAAQWISGPLNDMLQDHNPCDQSQVDHILSNFFLARYLEQKDALNKGREEILLPREPSPPPAQTKDKKTADKGKKNAIPERPSPPADPPEPVVPGSLAIGSVSLAAAKTGAQIKGLPLYKYIAALKDGQVQTKFHMPTALVTLLSCGKDTPGKLNLLEEVMVIPKAEQQVRQIVTMGLELQKEMMRILQTSTKAGAAYSVLGDSGVLTASYERAEQALDLITEACTNTGLALGTHVHLVLHCAASDLMDHAKGKYEVSMGVLKSPDELADMYLNLVSKYPAVVAIIDPFRREDIDQWERLSRGSCALLSDVTYKSKEPPLPGVSGHVLKHTNETTVSDLISATSEHQGSVLMGTTCSEPCNETSLLDIAVGLGHHYVSLGGLSGAERMNKYNRFISIEEELSQQGVLVYREKHCPPLFPDRSEEPST